MPSSSAGRGTRTFFGASVRVEQACGRGPSVSRTRTALVSMRVTWLRAGAPVSEDELSPEVDAVEELPHVVKDAGLRDP